ncbi:hypothetical protein BD413DRAFT_638053 [Trametes elegans]|nr:hypothetical protein BD413DRAFT_638053 [Trametes elegans]
MKLSNAYIGCFARRTPFNVDALEQVECLSVSAKSCTSWYPLGWGSYNRNFLLQFDNGATAVVRVPFPLAGNTERLVASEVATISYVCDRWLENDPLGIADASEGVRVECHPC